MPGEASERAAAAEQAVADAAAAAAKAKEQELAAAAAATAATEAEEEAARLAAEAEASGNEQEAALKIQAILRGKKARKDADEKKTAAAAAAAAAVAAKAVAAKACRSPPCHLRQHIGGECIAEKVVFWRETKVLPSKKKVLRGEKFDMIIGILSKVPVVVPPFYNSKQIQHVRLGGNYVCVFRLICYNTSGGWTATGGGGCCSRRCGGGGGGQGSERSHQNPGDQPWQKGS